MPNNTDSDHLEILVDTDCSHDDIKWLKNALNEYNAEALPGNNHHFTVINRDSKANIIAGAFIWTHGDTMYLDTLYVDKKHRKQGLGSLVLHAAESKGLVLNCTRCITDTLGFQAQPFYEKLGYQVIAEVPDYIQGHARIYLEKSLR
ncbi:MULTISPECIES: GNAT family N-acetyltransferase [unclassified Legionella]|uniref:GNAT family N-acetyltransferase n=1 Tax=unclassified Legionella TaxID=2622702 RepID=UPI001E358460|nr:GNAT family N-acetyltransferase [Legionella sp. 31fI33]MCC5013986.1 GNAT family N-acetyltransferase [Legionella sp. 31fI33]